MAQPNSRVTSTAYSQPHRPLAVALCNRLAAPLSRLGRGAERLLDDEALLRAARRGTGLERFADEEALRRPLSVLLASLRDEARLHPLGLVMVRQNLLRILSNRLRIDDALQRSPTIGSQPIKAPLFIVGLQRTGTTLLHRLLAQDERFRVLLSWEAINPAPLPRGLVGGDRRVRDAELAQRALTYLAPDFFAVHPVQAHAPEEDCLLFDYTFLSTVFEATLRVPSFSRWLEGQDHRGAYRYHAAILRYLLSQRQGDRRFLLKTPHHMEHLDLLLEMFPGARVIQPHRDPQRVLASFCSMVAHGRGVFSDSVDPNEVATHWAAKQQRMVDRCLELRSDPDLDRCFVDVAYADLVADPLATARSIYDALGWSLDGATEQRMRLFLARNPQHKHGRHRYRLEDFGLGASEVARQFSAYRQRFDIPKEGA